MPLPCQGLTLMRMRYPAPIHHPMEMQPDGAVRILVSPGDPWIGRPNLDAQFLAEFAFQRVSNGFPRFDLAAGKFPITRVHLAFGPLRQQEAAVRMLDNRRSDRNLAFNHGTDGYIDFCGNDSDELAAGPAFDLVASGIVPSKMPGDPAAAGAACQSPLQRFVTGLGPFLFRNT